MNKVFLFVVGPGIIAEQEHNGEQLLIKNVSIKVSQYWQFCIGVHVYVVSTTAAICFAIYLLYMYNPFVCFQTGPFNLNSPLLTTYNQKLWLTCVMQVENSKCKTTEWAVSHHDLKVLGVSTIHFFTEWQPLLLCVSVGDFQQPFEINIELKGVMQDASVMHINKALPKSRMLHCGAVRSKSQTCHFIKEIGDLLLLWCVGSPLQKCDDIIVLHLAYLNYTQYQVVVSFKGLENVTYEIKVKFVVSKDTVACVFLMSL